MKYRAFLLAALAVATTTISAAAQQPWIKNRAYGEGIGIRTGNLELHPGVAGEFGYDSNLFQRADDEDPILSAYRLRITPHLTLKTLGPQRREGDALPPAPTLTFIAGLYASYNAFFATDSEFSDEVSEHNDVAGGANFALNLFPAGKVGFDLYGDYVRTIEPSNVLIEDQAFDRGSLRGGTGVTWRPGGGLFEWRLGYEINYHYFESDAFNNLNNAHHYVKTRNRWRFLPRTALISEGEVGFIRYSDNTTQNDGETVKGRGGVNGLITNHFALLALAGWAASFYEPTAVPVRNYDGPIAHLELKWFPLPNPALQPGDATTGLASVGIGYLRDYNNSYLGDYYRRDRGYLNGSYFAGGVVLLSAEGGLTHETHSSSFFPGTGTQRNGSFTQNRADVTLFAEYRPLDTVGINGTFRYTAALDDVRIPITEGNPATDNLQYTRYEAYLGVRWFM